MVNAAARMTDTPVLVIGDMVADVYLDGEIARITKIGRASCRERV
mgnify:CR=1 FL=1